MLDMKQAIAIRLGDLPFGESEIMKINEISADYRGMLDSGRSSLLVLPGDSDGVRLRLSEAGFVIDGVDLVDLSEDEALFLSGFDEIDDAFGCEDDDGLDMDFDVLDDDDLDGYSGGPRF